MIPKYRRKILEEPVRSRLEVILREIAYEKVLEISALEIMPEDGILNSDRSGIQMEAITISFQGKQYRKYYRNGCIFVEKRE